MTKGDGKPCKKCGTSEWYTGGRCVQCMKDCTRQWIKNNPEKRAANNLRYKNANPEKKAASDLRWKKANPKKVAEQNRRWAKANPEKDAARKTRWAKANPEKVAEQKNKWKKTNPEKVISATNRRKTARTKAGGSYTVAEWKALVEHYGGKCLCCGRDDVKLTVDHIIPVSMGGTSNIDNIQPLCLSCNASKQDKHIDYRTKPGILRWIQRKLFD